jgi:TldD protein
MRRTHTSCDIKTRNVNHPSEKLSQDTLASMAEKALQTIMKLGADYADVRIEQTTLNAIHLANRRFEYVTAGRNFAFGLRALVNGAWGFSSSNSLSVRVIRKCAVDAFKMAKANAKDIKERVALIPVKTIRDHVICESKRPFADIEVREKMSGLMDIVMSLQESNERIGARILYEDIEGFKTSANSEGSEVTSSFSRMYMVISAAYSGLGKTVSRREQIGWSGDFRSFDDAVVEAMKTAKSLAESVLALSKAKPAPTGNFSVILDPKLAGVFVHETVGHACEADYILKSESIFGGKQGQKVASDLISVVDDPTIVGGWGSYVYDDECVPAKKRQLITRGVLTGFLNNRETAAKLEMEPNGAARVESSAHPPLVRVSNTCILAGDYSLREMFEDISFGVLLKGVKGGQVNTANGTFQFTAEEAYMIEKRKITAPLFNASLSGSIVEILRNVDGLSRDLEESVGFCNKQGQNVPVGSICPYVRIKKALITPA